MGIMLSLLDSSGRYQSPSSMYVVASLPRTTFLGFFRSILIYTMHA